MVRDERRPNMPIPGATTGGDGPAPDAVIRALSIKGFVTPQVLAPAVLTDEVRLRPVLEHMAADGLVVPKGPMYQLTEAGKARGAELVTADRQRWGVDAATRALDALLTLDLRMKETVTGWQPGSMPISRPPGWTATTASGSNSTRT